MASQSEERLIQRLSCIQHIVLVLSGKGGVGKSSVSVQLALSLLANNPSARVGLLDIDLTGPSLPRMLGLQGQDVHASDDGWVPVYLDARGPSGKGGVLACMSIGFLLKNTSESVVWRGPKKNAMIKQFLGEVRWGQLDYLIVDTPPGTSDEHISLLETLRPLLVPRQPDSPPLPTLSSLLVSTPQALALLDVSKELTFVRRTQLPLLGLIENMSGYVCPHCSDIVGIFGQGGAEDFCRREEERKHSTVEGEGGGCRFLGRIPIDRELVRLLDDVKEQAQSQAPGQQPPQDGSAPVATVPAVVRVVSPEEAEQLMSHQQQQQQQQQESAAEVEAAAAMVELNQQPPPAPAPPQPIRPGTTEPGSAAAVVASSPVTENQVKRATLVARYAAIPSAPIVGKIAQDVIRLIEEQGRAERAARGV